MDNSTNTTYSDQDYADYDRAAAVFYLIMFFLIVPLNSLVIFIVLKKENRQSRLNFFILHLAIADLLIGLVNVLGDGIESSMLGAYYGGDVMCRIWRYLKVVLSITSNDLLIGLSIDRYLAIAFPMMSMKRGSKLYKSLVIGAWVIGLVFAVFFIPFSEGVNGENGGCNITFGSQSWWKPYIIVLSLVIYVIPTIIITLCYIGICVVVWRRWKQNQNLSELHPSSQDGPGHKCVDTSNGLLSKARVKSVKMTLVICLAFFLCWTPYFVMCLLQVHNISTDRGLNTILGTLYCLNSLCNPIVFILFNRDKFLPSKLCRRECRAEEPETLMTYE